MLVGSSWSNSKRLQNAKLHSGSHQMQHQRCDERGDVQVVFSKDLKEWHINYPTSHSFRSGGVANTFFLGKSKTERSTAALVRSEPKVQGQEWGVRPMGMQRENLGELQLATL